MSLKTIPIPGTQIPQTTEKTITKTEKGWGHKYYYNFSYRILDDGCLKFVIKQWHKSTYLVRNNKGKYPDPAVIEVIKFNPTTQSMRFWFVIPAERYSEKVPTKRGSRHINTSLRYLWNNKKRLISRLRNGKTDWQADALEKLFDIIPPAVLKIAVKYHKPAYQWQTVRTLLRNPDLIKIWRENLSLAYWTRPVPKFGSHSPRLTINDVRKAAAKKTKLQRRAALAIHPYYKKYLTLEQQAKTTIDPNHQWRTAAKLWELAGELGVQVATVNPGLAALLSCKYLTSKQIRWSEHNYANSKVGFFCKEIASSETIEKLIYQGQHKLAWFLAGDLENQRDVSRWKLVAKTLSKCSPNINNLALVHYLYNIAGGPVGSKILQHLKGNNYTAEIFSLVHVSISLENLRSAPLIVPGLWLHIIETQRDLAHQACDTISMYMQLIEKGKSPSHLFPIKTVAQLARVHDKLTEEIALIEDTQAKEPFRDHPPLEPTENIVPLNTALEVEKEGKKMHHCVAAFVDQCRRGSYYVYKMTSPMRATIGVVPKDHPNFRYINVRTGEEIKNEQWVIHQAYGLCNEPLNTEALKEVNKWINESNKKLLKQENKNV